MYRVNLSLTHVLSVLILVGAAHLLMKTSCLVDDPLNQRLRGDAEVSLRRAAVIAEQAKQLDQSALVEKAEVFAEDPKIYKYMTLEDRPELYSFLKDKYSDISQSDIGEKLGKDRQTTEQEFSLSTEDIQHLAVHERLLVGKYRFQNWKKETQDQRNVDLNLLSRRPIQPDLVMALDSNGIGVAALGQDRYSWFGRNVAESHPGVLSTIKNADSDPQLKVPRTDIWQWSWSKGDDPSLYQVAIVPVRPSKQESPAGAIVVGYTIDDGTAEKNQRLFAGVTTSKDDATSEESALSSAPQVAFFRGQNIWASTFSSRRESKLESSIFEDRSILKNDNPEQLARFKVEDRSYIAFVRFFPGQFDVDNPSGFLILTDLSDVQSPIQQVLSKFHWFAGTVLVLGLVILLWLYRRLLQPLGPIEETISEILDGNKDATFVLADEHPVFSDLVENLNRMSAYLQGKPMPDEEMDEDWDWGEDLEGSASSASEAAGGGGGSPDVQGVEMPMKGDSDDSSSSDDETSEEPGEATTGEDPKQT